MAAEVRRETGGLELWHKLPSCIKRVSSYRSKAISEEQAHSVLALKADADKLDERVTEKSESQTSLCLVFNRRLGQSHCHQTTAIGPFLSARVLQEVGLKTQPTVANVGWICNPSAALAVIENQEPREKVGGKRDDKRDSDGLKSSP